MHPELVPADSPEASLFSRRQFLLATGGLVSTAALSTEVENATAAKDRAALEVASASVNHNWLEVQLTNDYAESVVVAPTLSYRGTNPASPRVRNPTSNQFELRVEEWRYLDGAHLTETVGYLAADPGSHELANGTVLETGRVRTDHTWAPVSFDASFETTPVVFSSAQGTNGSQPVVTRNRNAAKSGIEVRLQEEEAGGWHREEDVGYLAVESGSGAINGRPFEVGKQDDVGHAWQTVSFSQSYQRPVLLADTQTSRGNNTCTVRYRNLTSDSVEVKVEEEQSRDDETAHLGESIGYLVVEEEAASTVGYGVMGYGGTGYGK